MRQGMGLRCHAGILLALFCAGGPVVAGSSPPLPEPQSIFENLKQSRLDPSRAVEVQNLDIDLGLARLHLEDGILVPVSAVPNRTLEIVFTGLARFEIDAPDRIEAQQLRLFTNQSRFRATVDHAILVIGDEALASELLGRQALENGDIDAAADYYESWIRSGRRLAMGADRAVFKAAVGDGSYRPYLAVVCSSETNGVFYYRFDPSEQEQVRFGSFRTVLPREGSEDTDPTIETRTWLSSPLRSDDGTPLFGFSSIEPEHYTIEVRISDEGEGEGKAHLMLRTERDHTRVIGMELLEGLDVVDAKDIDERSLYWRRTESALDIVLPEHLGSGERLEIFVEFRGKLVEQVSTGVYRLRHTSHWYPRVGVVDRATYDVTFRWPTELKLISSGRRVGGGEEDDFQWERRVLNKPAIAFSFELGDFDVFTERFGYVDLTVAFSRGSPRVDDAMKQEVIAIVKAALAYFSQEFGLYPLEHLAVVTVPRNVSQGFLGFVTISHPLLFRPRDALLRTLLRVKGFSVQEQRAEILAHELAHQWWGNKVGWHSYRDQWLSEALADYSAVLFSGNLWPDAPLYLARHAMLWKESLRRRTDEGRTFESLGPVVLGRRLAENHSRNVYQAVVYDKGSVVFSMMALLLGRKPMRAMLKDLAEAVENREIETGTFIAALEHMSGAPLQGFANRFIYGTGVPEIYYRYDVAPAEAGGWIVRGDARQFPGVWSRYELTRNTEAWQLTRRTVTEDPLPEWTLVVPFQIATGSGVHPTDLVEATERGLGGLLALTEEVTAIEIPLEQKPREFWLDQRGEVLAEFICLNRRPREKHRRLADRLALAGEWEEAEQALRNALETEALRSGTLASPKEEKREVGKRDARIHLDLARLFLDQGRVSEAESQLAEASELLTGQRDVYRYERELFRSRIDMRQGKYRAAYTRLTFLDQNVESWPPESDTSADLETEALLVLAAAAHETGHEKTARWALERAESRGALPGELGTLLSD